MFLCLYVDDGIAMAASKKTLSTLINFLNKHFKAREVKTNLFVGFEFKRDNDGTTLHQASYIRRMVKSFNLVDATPTETPIVDRRCLEEITADDIQTNAPYREIIGSLY